MAEQPKNFGFGEDEVMLRDSARKFLSDHCSSDKLHRMVASDFNLDRPNECLWDQALWQQIVDLGWTAVCVPEAAGGIGMPAVAAIALAEEVGRAAFPSPLIATLSATFVLNACDSGAATAALTEIAGGKATALALTNTEGNWDSAATGVRVNADGRLEGVAAFVQDARKCAQFVVSAQKRRRRWFVSRLSDRGWTDPDTRQHH